MPHILALPGALRAASFNHGLIRAVTAAPPPGVTFEIATIRGIPVYDGDLEVSAYPGEATALKDRIAAADGVLIASPEYNGTLPGALKNAIDWTTRPGSDLPRVWKNKKVATIGATPGRFATIRSQLAWQAVWRTVGALSYPTDFVIAEAKTTFDEKTGDLTDKAALDRLHKWLAGFVAFVG